MSEKNPEESLLTTWAGAQQKLLTGWLDLVQKSVLCSYPRFSSRSPIMLRVSLLLRRDALVCHRYLAQTSSGEMHIGTLTSNSNRVPMNPCYTSHYEKTLCLCMN
jgi:hypothetical protein